MLQRMLWFFHEHRVQLYRVGVVTARYIWPEVRRRQRAEALRPLLILHSFRFICLAVLVPGVASPLQGEPMLTLKMAFRNIFCKTRPPIPLFQAWKLRESDSSLSRLLHLKNMDHRGSGQWEFRLKALRFRKPLTECGCAIQVGAVFLTK
jgi:hypothetical protein